jgi:ribosomal protein S27AE
MTVLNRVNMNDTKIKPNFCTRCGADLLLHYAGYRKYPETGKVSPVYYIYCPECGEKIKL